jgi:hypothetical protein
MAAAEEKRKADGRENTRRAKALQHAETVNRGLIWDRSIALSTVQRRILSALNVRMTLSPSFLRGALESSQEFNVRAEKYFVTNGRSRGRRFSALYFRL